MAVRKWVARVGRVSSLGAMLEESSSRYPRRKAVFINGDAISYRELNAAANRYAHAMREKLGIGPSDRIALLLDNGTDFIYSCFGALKAGAAVVPLNIFLTPPELHYILEDAGVKVLVSSDRFAPFVRRVSEQVPSLEALVTVGREDLGGDTWLREELLRGARASNPNRHVKREDLAVVIYTSGTTGKPKGAMLTHGNLLSNIMSSGQSIRITKKDRLMLMLPMFHSFTLTVCMLMPIAVGGSMIVTGKLRSISHIVKLTILRRATIFIGIPHFYDIIASRGVPFWLRPLIRLRLCVSGSAPLSVQTLNKFDKNVGIPLLEGYGLSETSPVVSINPLGGVRKPGSVGKPIQGVSVRIVSGEGEPLPPGSVGEIAVSGPNVMKGYLNRPRETKETLRDGWLLTGDIGKLDEDGYIYILDRKKDMILFHGMNIYPREIEEVLYSHPSVAEAAVVGRADRRRGEVPVAVVSLEKGKEVEPSALIRFCSGSLARYKVPHRIVILEKLPRTATGKILKREIKKKLSSLTTESKGVIHNR